MSVPAEFMHSDLADSLRAAAAVFTTYKDTLPAPLYPEQPQKLNIYLASREDLDQVAKVIGLPVDERRNPAITLDLGGLELSWVYVSRESIARHQAQTSYASNVQVTP